VPGGLVKWERTMGDIFSDAGYNTSIVGKWHIGESKGRWPTDHGFDEWYGIPHTWDEHFGRTIPTMTPSVTRCHSSWKVKKVNRHVILSNLLWMVDVISMLNP
jgi:arylsulfatase A-like enzyme